MQKTEKAYVCTLWIILFFASLDSAIDCDNLDECRKCDEAVAADGTRLCEWCASSNRCVTKHFYSCFFGEKIISSSDCPLNVHKGDTYSDEFARTKMLALSAAAYWDDPQSCLTNRLNDAQVVRQTTVPCDASNTTICSAFTAISNDNRAIILSFRGTSTLLQLWTESWETAFENKIGLVGGGEITGHSLGAAMASIASNVIVAEGLYPSKLIKLVTFGQPRTGDQNFAAAHDRMVWYSYRVVHARDLVVHLPPLDFMGYQHHRYEVWYDNDMALGEPFKVCLTPDNGSCSDSDFFDGSIEDHLHYFEKALTWWGKDGCQ